MSKFSSWLSANKAVIIHSLGVVGIVATTVAKATGNGAAIAGIAAITSAFHVGEGLAAGQGLSGAGEAITEAAAALKELIGNATAANGAADTVG